MLSRVPGYTCACGCHLMDYCYPMSQLSGKYPISVVVVVVAGCCCCCFLLFLCVCVSFFCFVLFCFSSVNYHLI